MRTLLARGGRGEFDAAAVLALAAFGHALRALAELGILLEEGADPGRRGSGLRGADQATGPAVGEGEEPEVREPEAHQSCDRKLPPPALAILAAQVRGEAPLLVAEPPDEAPMLLSGSVDLRVGTTCAFAVLAALYHRERTGQGQEIDLSSTEVMSSMMGEAFLAYSMSGRVPQRSGNRDGSMAPHGCYRVKGEPQWISIAVGSEAEWTALRSVVDDPALEEEAFADPLERWRNQDRLDGIIERWTCEREAEEAVARLQRAGVASMVVHTGATLPRDRHVRERGILETVHHPRIGERTVVGPPWRLDGVGVRRAAPLLGEHNRYVLGEVLGLPEDEIRRLEQAGALH